MSTSKVVGIKNYCSHCVCGSLLIKMLAFFNVLLLCFLCSSPCAHTYGLLSSIFSCTSLWKKKHLCEWIWGRMHVKRRRNRRRTPGFRGKEMCSFQGDQGESGQGRGQRFGRHTSCFGAETWARRLRTANWRGQRAGQVGRRREPATPAVRQSAQASHAGGLRDANSSGSSRERIPERRG